MGISFRVLGFLALRLRRFRHSHSDDPGEACGSRSEKVSCKTD